MKKIGRASPRFKPETVHRYFCDLMKQNPGELKLSLEKDFNALVGQFFVAPMRAAFLGLSNNNPETAPIAEYLALTYGKIWKIALEWHEIIDKHLQAEKEGLAKDRIYTNRNRTSVSDNLWKVLGLLYWNHAVWIILRGEYKAMRKALSDTDCEKELRSRYSYLPQLQEDGFAAELKKGSPKDLALRDTARKRGLEEASLKLLLSPGRLSKSPPASLVQTYMDSTKLLARLKRIPAPSHREKVLIRLLTANL